MVLETKSGLEGAVIGGGHSIAAARLDAQRSVAGWVSEQMGGLSYLFYIRDLVRHRKPCKTACSDLVPCQGSCLDPRSSTPDCCPLQNIMLHVRLLVLLTALCCAVCT